MQRHCGELDELGCRYGRCLDLCSHSFSSSISSADKGALGHSVRLHPKTCTLKPKTAHALSASPRKTRSQGIHISQLAELDAIL